MTVARQVAMGSIDAIILNSMTDNTVRFRWCPFLIYLGFLVVLHDGGEGL